MSNDKIGGYHLDVIREAEAAVLGACLLDPDEFLKVRGVIGAEPKVFWFANHQTLWEAFNDTWDSGDPLDFTSIDWWLGDNGRLGDVVSAEVMDLIDGTPSSIHAVHYAKRVMECYRGRELQRIAGGAMDRLFRDQADIDAIQAWVMDQVLDNARPSEESESVRDLVGGVTERLKMVRKARNDGGQVGIPFKLGAVDKIVGGLRGSDLCILAARPAMGKTTAALQLALNTALDGGRVLFYSLEMSHEQLIAKLVSHLTGIGYDELRQGTWKEEDAVFLDAAEQTLAGLDIVIKDALFLVDEMRDHAMAYSVQHDPPDLIVVDYIQLSGVQGNDRLSDNARVGAISRTLKLLARALDAPVLALSQLSRKVEDRSDKRPQLSDLRDSGSLEQDADEVIFLYRDGYYDEASETPNVLEWLVRKNRHGPTGSGSTFFDMPRGQIKELVINRHDLNC